MTQLYNIWGYHSGADEDCCLLGYEAMYIDTLGMFQEE
jgi:hypothetical protein